MHLHQQVNRVIISLLSFPPRQPVESSLRCLHLFSSFPHSISGCLGETRCHSSAHGHQARTKPTLIRRIAGRRAPRRQQIFSYHLQTTLQASVAPVLARHPHFRSAITPTLPSSSRLIRQISPRGRANNNNNNQSYTTPTSRTRKTTTQPLQQQYRATCRRRSHRRSCASPQRQRSRQPTQLQQHFTPRLVSSPVCSSSKNNFNS